MKSFFSLLGKICLSSIFIFNAMQDLLQWNAREQHVYELFTSILHSGRGGDLVLNAIGYLAQNMTIVFALAVFFQLMGGVSLLFSWKEKMGASFLLVYLIPSTLVFHDFWNMMAEMRAEHMHLFGMNIAVAGGLFLVLSLDKKQKGTPEKKTS